MEFAAGGIRQLTQKQRELLQMKFTPSRLITTGAEQIAVAEIFLASSNPGKLREYVSSLLIGWANWKSRAAEFSRLPSFEESRADIRRKHRRKSICIIAIFQRSCSRKIPGSSFPRSAALPGVHSARYAGPNATDEDRIRKLLGEMKGKEGRERRAQFICVIDVARARAGDRCRFRLVGGHPDRTNPEDRRVRLRPFIFIRRARSNVFAETSETEKNMLQPSWQGVPQSAVQHLPPQTMRLSYRSVHLNDVAYESSLPLNAKCGSRNVLPPFVR